MTTSFEDKTARDGAPAKEAQSKFDRLATFENLAKWQKETFGIASPADIAVRMLGEAVEVCIKAGAPPYEIQAAVTAEIGRRSCDQVYDANGVLGELADMFIFLVANAVANGFSEDEVNDAVQAKHEINMDREWNLIKPGVAQHVEPSGMIPGDDPGDSNDA